MFLGTELQVMFGFTIAVLSYFIIFVPTWHKCLLNWHAAHPPPALALRAPLTPPPPPSSCRRFGYGMLAAYILFVIVYTALGLEHFT